MAKHLKSEIVREYRKKYGMKMPTTDLAKLILKENGIIFDSVEQVRSALRYIEGKLGAKKKEKLSNKEFVMNENRSNNPYCLPDSEETSYDPYVIKGVSCLGVISDIHIPYHSIEAITAALNEFKRRKVDGILINGDLIDFYQLSRFNKDPRKRSVAHEIKATNDFLDSLQKHFPKAKIFYKSGNHCVRYNHFLLLKAPELLGIPEIEFASLLKLKERKIVHIGDKTIVKANSLNLIHGHEFGGSVFSPVNIARGLYLKGKTSAMQGHNHQVSEHTEPNMNGEITTTWSLGCLCELHPEYLPINKWAHGAAVVDLHRNGKDFSVHNFRIYKGKVL